MATENDVQQTLSDIPTWLFVLVSMAGLSGELWRAEAAGLTVSDLLKRVLLRSGASVVFGLASVLLATASGAGLPVAAALGSVVACLGADVTSGFYTRWLARRAGMPPAGDEQRGGPASPLKIPIFGSFPSPRPYTGTRTRVFPLAVISTGMSVFSRG